MSRIRRCLDANRLRRERSSNAFQPGNELTFPTVIDENYYRYIPGDLGTSGSFFDYGGGNWHDDSGVAPFNQYSLNLVNELDPVSLQVVNPSIAAYINNVTTLHLGVNSKAFHHLVDGTKVDRTKGYRVNFWYMFNDPAHFINYEIDLQWDAVGNGIFVSTNSANTLQVLSFNGATAIVPWVPGVANHFDCIMNPNGLLQVRMDGTLIVTTNVAPPVNSAASLLQFNMQWLDTVDDTLRIGGVQWRGYRI